MDDRLSFRRFCGIPLDRPVPDHSSIWLFCQHLTIKDEAGLSLGKRLLAAINPQLDERGLVLKRGTLIDAMAVDIHRKLCPQSKRYYEKKRAEGKNL